ncbi:MAG: AAA family ATPase [Myxococcales bacterium]|nr:AAA family ATPase [Myxococcota bacterium]MDW8280443.1 AAA family ATPase [Myxococcales bacterium]
MPLPPLPPDALSRRCPPEQLPFETTSDLEDMKLFVGHERALEALRFGLGIRQQGYNLFALGPPGMGKHTLVRQLLEERAASEQTPPDLCHVNNFADPQKPRLLQLPPGRGAALRRDMDRFISALRLALPGAFESEAYRMRRRLLDKELEEEQEEIFGAIERRAAERNIVVVRTPVGLALAPMRDGEVMKPEEFAQLPEEEQDRFQQDISALEGELREALARLPQWRREAWERRRKLDAEVISHAIADLVDELRRAYADLPQVQEHLQAMQEHLVEHYKDFLPQEGEESPPSEAAGEEEDYRIYQVNLLVDHSQTRGAPVVYEDHPTLANLIGRIEHIAHYGALMTDFNLIRAGALHRAHGGYLILDADKVLQQPLAWEGLKRALRSGEVRIESLEQALSLVSTVSLEPEPAPLSVKVVLLGDRWLYYLLYELDPDFPVLFKVPVDFDEYVVRSPETELLYARLMASMVRRDRLLPVHRGAVARLIEEASRRAGDAEHLSTHLGPLGDLLREADHVARQAGRETVTAADVQEAIDGRERRWGRVRRELIEEIYRGVVLIDTSGERIGQVNGLSVVQLGPATFGRPARITARVRPGKGEVVDIERIVELGGPIHSKGVLILSGFLGARYACEQPLSLHASLVFEQSYGVVEGDSASVAELLALLSALAEAPVRQWLAVTGSVNQHGEVQAIGGVNEKIEGFFDLCQRRGLTGQQGVLVPQANVRHLMLRHDVVAAVAEGRFHVYPIETVDDALELLCGQPAGQRQGRRGFPPDSLNGRVEARLRAFAEAVRTFSAARRGPPRPPHRTRLEPRANGGGIRPAGRRGGRR